MAVQKIKTPVKPIEVPVGKFIKYYASITFNIGVIVNNSTQNIQISIGDELEYDGSTVKHNGSLYPSPSFRGAVIRGWVSTNRKKTSEPVKDVKVQPRFSQEDKEEKEKSQFLTNVENQEETVIGDYRSIRKIKRESSEVEAMDDGDVVAKIGNPVKSATVVNSSTDHLKKIREIEGERLNLVKVHPKDKQDSIVKEIESEAKSDTTVISDTGSEKKIKKEAKKDTKKESKKSNEAKKAAAEVAAKKREERLSFLAASENKSGSPE